MTHITHLRAVHRVALETMAQRLTLSVDDLRALERTELRLWEVRTLAEYAQALGYSLRLTVTREGDGRRLELGQ